MTEFSEFIGMRKTRFRVNIITVSPLGALLTTVKSIALAVGYATTVYRCFFEWRLEKRLLEIRETLFLNFGVSTWYRNLQRKEVQALLDHKL